MLSGGACNPKYAMASIFESIVENPTLPKKFWLVFDIPSWSTSDDRVVERNNRILADIASGNLTGVKGISDSREIMTSWFMMGRNAAVVMDSSAVVAQNDIQKIDYLNPEYLCSDNMAPLYRIWNREHRDKLGDYGVMQNMIQYLERGLDQRTAHNFSYNGLASRLADVWAKHPEGVNSIDDLTQVILDMIPQACDSYIARDILDHASFDGMKKAVLFALAYVARVYGEEAEWLVKSSSFHIPKGSKLIIGIDKKSIPDYHKWKNDPDQVWGFKGHYEAIDRLLHIVEQYHLRDYYDVSFVDSRQFEQVRDVVLTKRRKKSS